MRKSIRYYHLIYQLGGAGYLQLFLEGENAPRQLGPLSPEVLTAAAAVLNQKRLFFDPTKNVILATDTDDSLDSLVTPQDLQ